MALSPGAADARDAALSARVPKRSGHLKAGSVSTTFRNVNVISRLR